jgi:hypothetical protein
MLFKRRTMGTTFPFWSLQNRREHRTTASTGRIITAPVTRYVTRAALATRTSVASTSASEARGCESKQEAHVTVR